MVALAAVALISMLLSAWLLHRGENLRDAFDGTGLLLSSRIMEPTGIDSWRPMLAAYEHEKAKPGSLYWVFLTKGVKFQYPPSSLLVMPLMPFPIDQSFREKVAVPSYLAVFFTILCSGLIAIKLLALPKRAIEWRDRFNYCIVALIAMLGWLYYPLMMGHSLGQIQVYVGALIALALLCKAAEYPVLSGVCVGLCCLLKPQYALALVWGVLRRELRFVLGLVITVAIGLGASLYTFGLHNHLDYLEVLGRLSRFGEAYGPNQTVNGLLQRWLENGSPIKFERRKLPPYQPVIYYGTLASSLLYMALALFTPMAKSLRGRAIDLALLIVAATLASPIAWEHHYGAFFPVLAVAVAAPFAQGRAGVLLIFAYVLMAVELMRPQIIYADRWTGLLGSHRFFGGLLLFAFLLLASRKRPEEPPPAPVAS